MIENLINLLKSNGYKAVFNYYPQKNNKPYLVVSQLPDVLFFADDGIYTSNPRFQIELFTNQKEPLFEKQLYSLLIKNNLIPTIDYSDERDDLSKNYITIFEFEMEGK